MEGELKDLIQKRISTLKNMPDILPDYILSLVLNNHSKEYIRDELKLFLENDTSAFVEWLFDRLSNDTNKNSSNLTNNPEFSSIPTTISNIQLEEDEDIVKCDFESENIDRKLKKFKDVLNKAAQSAKHNKSAMKVSVSPKVIVGKKSQPKRSTIKDELLNLPPTDLRHVLQKRKSRRKIEFEPSETENKQILNEVIDSSNTPVQTYTIRCKFWPSCTNSNCLYNHPKSICRYFPNCINGKNCQFGHPLCKFNKDCKNAGCLYYHEISLNTIPNKSIIPCKFNDKCNQPSCPFYHGNKISNSALDSFEDQDNELVEKMFSINTKSI